jgi:hypothetical protein
MFSALAGLTDNSPDKEAQLISPEPIQFSPIKNFTIPAPSEKIVEEPPKPKINVMTLQEQKSYFDEQNRQAKMDKFEKEFNSKKNQSEGKIWNEATGKFEKHSEVALMEKEVESMMKDSKLDLKKAKTVDKNLAEQIMKNPEKSKEILNTQIKKIDPREALKDLNQDLVNDILAEDERKKIVNQQNEKNYLTSKVKQESYRKDRDYRDKSMIRDNYEKKKSRDVSEAKSSNFTRDKSQIRGRDTNRDKSSYKERSKDYSRDYSDNKSYKGRSYDTNKKEYSREKNDKSKSKDEEKEKGRDRSVSKVPERDQKSNFSNHSNNKSFKGNFNNRNNYSQSNNYSQVKESRSPDKSECRPRDKSECRPRDKSECRPSDKSQVRTNLESNLNQNFQNQTHNFSNRKINSNNSYNWSRNRNFNNINNGYVNSNGNFLNNNFTGNQNFNNSNNINSGTGNQFNSQQQLTNFQPNNQVQNHILNQNTSYFNKYNWKNNNNRENCQNQTNLPSQAQNNFNSNTVPNPNFSTNNFNSQNRYRDKSPSQCRPNKNFQALVQPIDAQSSPNFNREKGKINNNDQFPNKNNRYSRSPSAIRGNNNFPFQNQVKNHHFNKTPQNPNYAPSPINLMTPVKSCISNTNEIDLTGEDDIVLPPVYFGNDGEIENFKRKKMRDDLTDLMVNLKGNSASDISEEEISNNLLKELKNIAQETSFTQLIRCREYVKNKLSITRENILKEYIAFRDKSMNASNDMLILSSFYFMWLYENKVRSKEILSEKLKETEKEISSSQIIPQGNKKDLSQSYLSELNTGLRISQASTVNTVNPVSNSKNFTNLPQPQGKGVGDILFGDNSMCSSANINKSQPIINEKNRDRSKSPLPNRQKKVEKTAKINPRERKEEMMEVEEETEKITTPRRGRERSKTPARVPDFAKSKDKKIVIETTQLREKSAEPKRKEKNDKTEKIEKSEKPCQKSKIENSKDNKDKSVEPQRKNKRDKSPTPLPIIIPKPQEFLKQKRKTEDNEHIEASSKTNKKRRIEDESRVENEKSNKKNNVINEY